MQELKKNYDTRNMEFDFDNQIVSNIPYLKNYAKRFSLKEEEAEDLTSDTFLKALEKREYFRQGDGTNFRGWLVTIMTNLFINKYRLGKRQATDNYDNEEIVLLAEQKKYSKSTDSDFINRELFDLVKLTLSPIDYRVIMAYANGYAYEQISEIMEISLGTIKSKIFSARKKLIEIIKTEGYE